MTVSELIAKLSEFDPDTPVVIHSAGGGPRVYEFERGTGGYRAVAEPTVDTAVASVVPLAESRPWAEYPRVQVVSLG